MPRSGRASRCARHVAEFFIAGVREVLKNHPYNETELKLAEEAQIEGLDVPDGCHPVLWAAAKDLLIVFWFIPCFWFCLAGACCVTIENDDDFRARTDFRARAPTSEQVPTSEHVARTSSLKTLLKRLKRLKRLVL